MRALIEYGKKHWAMLVGYVTSFVVGALWGFRAVLVLVVGVGVGWLVLRAALWVLDHEAEAMRWKRWRVLYVSECLYGGPPTGWPPRIVWTSYHWTEWGADRYRHRAPARSSFLSMISWGSGMLVTHMEQRPKGEDWPQSPVEVIAS